MLTKKEKKLLSMHLSPEMFFKLTGEKEDVGMIAARAMISGKLVEKAMEGNVYAMDLWLKMNGLINKEATDLDTELTIRREVVNAPITHQAGQQGASKG